MVPNSLGAHQSPQAQKPGPGWSMSTYAYGLDRDLLSFSRGYRSVAASLPSQYNYLIKGTIYQD